MKNLKEEDTSQCLNSYLKEKSKLGSGVKGTFYFCFAQFLINVNHS